jgi:hypothetical protein
MRPGNALCGALLVVASVAIATPAAAGDQEDVLSRVQQIVLDWNRRDFQALAADMTQSPDIIDEFRPFHWSGLSAIEDWNRDYDTDAARHGVRDATMQVSKPSHVDIAGTTAYVILPSVVRYKQAGGVGSEKGTLTMSLEKVGSTWRISAFSWTQRQ